MTKEMTPEEFNRYALNHGIAMRVCSGNTVIATGDADPAFLELAQKMPSVDDVLEAIAQEAFKLFDEGNVVIGEFGENIIRDALKKAMNYHLSAL